ncbi:GNAT family N-acetyltransferase [Ureibacillus manganicus]|uniref:GCN5 family acetyltransferase n=1 Tax=Ureibacillus manganicus DSM 26584 TaxID=1384049 RepID=A0A0A3IR43_9BACL|nr:GNAT family N-acetyltransferase [Ureibacillus manganicus]KGR77272.1 GCN5 family acetyltransferase [Ureibacillus manganicus DSM 26584]
MLDENITIRPLSMDDYETVLKWSKDEVFCSANSWETNRDADEIYQWWLKCVNVLSDDFIRLGIDWNKQLIGYVDLACINNKSAEIGIAIGERSLWGKGIGFLAAKRMVEYASLKLGVTVFNAETHETNFRSRRMLKKLGFKEISRIGMEEYLGLKTQLIQYKLNL